MVGIRLLVLRIRRDDLRFLTKPDYGLRQCSGAFNRSWQKPSLSPTHVHDGSGVRGHRPRYKGSRDTHRRKILRNPAAIDRPHFAHQE